jgi:ubiquinone/menaquinone biosynthesis C-methylase UbiE
MTKTKKKSNVLPKASHSSTNDVVYELINKMNPFDGHILDVGAGSGYMAQRVGELSKSKGKTPESVLRACDMFPEKFQYKDVVCDKFEFEREYPYNDNTFDLVYSIEVIEHLYHPFHFLQDTYRILKPGGHLIYTTPNVLNLNSRISYLFKGFFILFNPLLLGKQHAGSSSGHVMPLSYYYMQYYLRKIGYVDINCYHDRFKKSASFYYCLLYPFLKLSTKLMISKSKRIGKNCYEENMRQISEINSRTIACSRSCIVVARIP